MNEPTSIEGILTNPETIEQVLTEKMYPMSDVRAWLDELIHYITPGLEEGGLVYVLLSLGIILGFSFLIWLLLKLLFVTTLPKLMQRVSFLSTAGTVNGKIIKKLISIITVSIFTSLLPVVWPVPTLWFNILKALCNVYIVWTVAQIIGYLFDVGRRNMLQSSKYSNSPFINLFQVFKGFVFFIAILIIISIIFKVDMTAIGAGLTALSAVLMLVFKDTILGFVASIQLSNNDMVRVGDWITVPKYGVDGDVIDISLATIKVKNFDNTVSTLPPYSLISESFQNWRPMQEDGGRRVKRSIDIDIQTIKHADDALLDRLRNAPVLKDYINTALEDIIKDNKARGLENSYAGRGLTNVGLYRRYIDLYLKDHPRVHKAFTCMVRQQQPTSKGLPIELYFFTNTTVWAEYEDIQSDIFDHLLSVISVFELSVFQEVNAYTLVKTFDGKKICAEDTSEKDIKK